MSQEIQVLDDQQKALAINTREKPADIVARAIEAANVLAPIIEDKKLYKVIGKDGKRHVMAEAWSALMGLLEVDPIVEYCRRLEREDEIAYEARVLLVRNGQTICAAETIASNKENATWSRSEQGIKSMAQTRALGKACRLKFSWIVVLAGYVPTAAEELDEFDRATIQTPKAKSAEKVQVETEEIPWPGSHEELPMPKPIKTISEKQRKMIWAKCRAANISEETLKEFIKETFSVEHTNELPWQAMDPIIKWIDKRAELNQVGN